MNQMAQGDILLVASTEVPLAAKAKPDGIVAEGEATGHHHRITGDVMFYENPEPDIFVGGWIVAGPDGGALVHEEHGTIEVAPNTVWTVRRQVEADPFTGVARRVAD